MRHRKKGRHFSRTAEHRNLMLRNLAASLFLHDRIETTVAKAKELRRFAEPLITKAKRGDLHARRLVRRKIHDGDALARLFNEIGPRFADRPGGYTRLVHLGHRPGDAAEMAIIELVE
ncbi:MAG TPA: 50S ribosomal protein L17 [Longimicrobiales bacterium]